MSATGKRHKIPVLIQRHNNKSTSSEDDEEDRLELEVPGENWLQLVPRGTSNNTKCILDDTQDTTAAGAAAGGGGGDVASIPYPSILSGTVQRDENTFLVLDVDDSFVIGNGDDNSKNNNDNKEIWVAIKDVRRPSNNSQQKQLRSSRNSNCNSNDDSDHDVENNDDDSEFEIRLVRRSAKNNNNNDESKNKNKTNHKNTLWPEYGHFEQLPRRQMRLLRPGDRLCIRSKTDIMEDGEDNEIITADNALSVGLVLEFGMVDVPYDRHTNANAENVEASVADDTQATIASTSHPMQHNSKQTADSKDSDDDDTVMEEEKEDSQLDKFADSKAKQLQVVLPDSSSSSPTDTAGQEENDACGLALTQPEGILNSMETQEDDNEKEMAPATQAFPTGTTTTELATQPDDDDDDSATTEYNDESKNDDTKKPDIEQAPAKADSALPEAEVEDKEGSSEPKTTQEETEGNQEMESASDDKKVDIGNDNNNPEEVVNDNDDDSTTMSLEEGNTNVAKQSSDKTATMTKKTNEDVVPISIVATEAAAKEEKEIKSDDDKEVAMEDRKEDDDEATQDLVNDITTEEAPDQSCNDEAEKKVVTEDTMEYATQDDEETQPVIKEKESKNPAVEKTEPETPVKQQADKEDEKKEAADDCDMDATQDITEEQGNENDATQDMAAKKEADETAQDSKPQEQMKEEDSAEGEDQKSSDKEDGQDKADKVEEKCPENENQKQPKSITVEQANYAASEEKDASEDWHSPEVSVGTKNGSQRKQVKKYGGRKRKADTTKETVESTYPDSDNSANAKKSSKSKRSKSPETPPKSPEVQADKKEEAQKEADGEAKDEEETTNNLATPTKISAASGASSSQARKKEGTTILDSIMSDESTEETSPPSKKSTKSRSKKKEVVRVNRRKLDPLVEDPEEKEFDAAVPSTKLKISPAARNSPDNISDPTKNRRSRARKTNTKTSPNRPANAATASSALESPSPPPSPPKETPARGTRKRKTEKSVSVQKAIPKRARATPKRTAKDNSGEEKETVAGEEIRVVTTGVSLSKSMINIITKKLGGTLLEDVSHAPTATHVIASDKKVPLRRTPKLMIGLCATGNIVNVDWLVKSGKANEALPADEFLVDDKEAEKKYDFSMEESVKRGNSMRENGEKLLSGWYVHVCKGVASNKAPPEKEMKLIVEVAGGEWLPSLTPKTTKDLDTYQLLIITSDPEQKKQISTKGVAAALQDGATKKTTSWLFGCIMKQKLDL